MVIMSISEKQKEIMLDHFWNNMNDEEIEERCKESIKLEWTLSSKSMLEDWDQYLTFLNNGGELNVKLAIDS
tara:strand:- start:662 stop:877 length:216 start_codon:yes stop_codon:yes gene_type:complete